MTDYTRQTRTTLVVSAWVQHRIPGQDLHPENEPERWWVWLVTKSGSKPTTTRFFPFDTASQAEDFFRSKPPGTVFDDAPVYFMSEFREAGVDEQRLIDSGFVGRIGSAGDEESPLAFEVLEKAGLRGYASGVSDEVKNALGTARIDEIKDKHGENWKVAATFEFCWIHLPHSAAAYLASAYQYNWYVLGDDFSAGYFWRDLEVVVDGVESRARKADKITEAAKAGGAARAAATSAVREQILEIMSKFIANGKPISEAARFAAMRGFGTSTEANRKLWNRHKSGT